MLRDEGWDVTEFTLDKHKEGDGLPANTSRPGRPFRQPEIPRRSAQQPSGSGRDRAWNSYRTAAFSVAYRKGATRLVKADRAQHRKTFHLARH